jgi:hypothetical protein
VSEADIRSHVVQQKAVPARVSPEDFEEFQAERLANRALSVLQRKLWIATIVVSGLALIGVPLSARTFLSSEMQDVEKAKARAEVAAEELAKQITLVQQKEQEATQAISEVTKAAADARQALGDLESRLSELRGSIEREGFAMSLRVESVDKQLKVLAEAIEKHDVKAKVQAISEKELEVRKDFASKEATTVKIAYAPRATAKARDFQTKLSSHGYATTLASTNFAEIGGAREADTLQVIARPEEIDRARAVAKAVGTQDSNVRSSPKLNAGSVNIYLF